MYFCHQGIMLHFTAFTNTSIVCSIAITASIAPGRIVYAEEECGDEDGFHLKCELWSDLDLERNRKRERETKYALIFILVNSCH